MSKPVQYGFNDQDRKEHGEHQRAEDPFHHAAQTRIRLGLVVGGVGHHKVLIGYDRN
jgi:hypothetical protein